MFVGTPCLYPLISGTISKLEARDALRTNKGNIWVAVTDCVETRQKKVSKQSVFRDAHKGELREGGLTI